jgi:hypothetical protein
MYGHWITKVEFNPDDFTGFVYLVINVLTGQKYIGKKNFRVNTRTTENWQEYTSSSKYLNEDIIKLGKENFRFEILYLCKTKEELDNLEIKEQKDRNILKSLLPNGTREYYNRYIHKVGLSTNGVKFKEEIKEKMRKTHTGVPHNSKDKDLYLFKNIITNEIVNWTRKEFYDTVGADPCKLVIRKAKSVRKWVCLNPREHMIRNYPSDRK